MSVESAARKLLELRTRLDQLDREYEAQRLEVHNALVNAQKDFVEVDGYKIAHVPESTYMQFSQELLRTELKRLGLNDQAINGVIFASKAETTRDNIIRVTKIA